MGHSVILIATAVVMSYFISNPRLDKVARPRVLLLSLIVLMVSTTSSLCVGVFDDHENCLGTSEASMSI